MSEVNTVHSEDSPTTMPAQQASASLSGDSEPLTSGIRSTLDNSRSSSGNRNKKIFRLVCPAVDCRDRLWAEPSNVLLQLLAKRPQRDTYDPKAPQNMGYSFPLALEEHNDDVCRRIKHENSTVHYVNQGWPEQSDYTALMSRVSSLRTDLLDVIAGARDGFIYQLLLTEMKNDSASDRLEEKLLEDLNRAMTGQTEGTTGHWCRYQTWGKHMCIIRLIGGGAPQWNVSSSHHSTRRLSLLALGIENDYLKRYLHTTLCAPSYKLPQRAIIQPLRSVSTIVDTSAPLRPLDYHSQPPQLGDRACRASQDPESCQL